MCASHNGKNKIPNLINSIKIHYYQMKLLSAGLAKDLSKLDKIDIHKY